MTQIQNSIETGAMFAKASRPQNAVYSGCLAIAAYIASGGRLLSITALCLFGFFIFMYAIAAIYNNLQDIATDKINKRFDNPFVKAKVPVWQLVNFTVSMVIGAIVCVSFLKLPVSLIVFVISLLVIFSYSNPFIRLKSRGFAGILTLGIPYTILPILLGYLQNESVSPLLLFTCGAVYFVSLAGLLAKDYKDQSGDRASGVHTVLVRHGEGIVHKLTLLCFIVGLMIQVYITFAFSLSLWGLAPLIAYGCFVYVLHKNKGQLSLRYMRLGQTCLLAFTYLNLV